MLCLQPYLDEQCRLPVAAEECKLETIKYLYCSGSLYCEPTSYEWNETGTECWGTGNCPFDTAIGSHCVLEDSGEVVCECTRNDEFIGTCQPYQPIVNCYADSSCCTILAFEQP
jgi:hypothetical protein